MTTLTSAEFSRRFQDQSIDLSAVRADARTSRAMDQALTRADANGDARLEGPSELAAASCAATRQTRSIACVKPHAATA